ncbi:iron-containing alcohol dehydrogenase [Salinigranum rubrum]|nr:iron-containing alcohol dehydrogenase [Salinigranum rubrum]
MDSIDPTPLSFTATRFRFGEGIVDELPVVLDQFTISSPLVVTDAGIREAGLLDRVIAETDAEHIYESTTEPTTDDFDDLPTENVDSVVAIGGGSVLDTAKVIALLLAHGGHPGEYIGSGKIPGEISPLVAIPTTSGTGSEVSQTAVVTHEGVKRGISDERLRPMLALVDPELTYDLPQSVTARSGFDALMHSLEGLTARDYRWVEDRPITYQGANPISRSLARRALGLVYGSLERAVFDGDDHGARRGMSLGSCLAAVAHSNSGLGAIHALASAVGGITGRPHGECLAASVEPALEYNLPIRRDAYAELADEFGVGDTAEAFIAEITRVRDDIGLPPSFSELGLDQSDADRIVEATLVQERRLKTNPRVVSEDIETVVSAHLE